MSVDDAAVAARLREAPFEVVGRFADASNATLLVRLLDRHPLALDELAADLGRDIEVDDLDPVDLAVHKPRRGEAPLWDFPAGTLHRREVAAYEVSAALGWDLVPVTVLASGEFGVGSLQRFVPHDPAEHYFHLVELGDDDLVAELRRMVLFDLVIDDADRKGGHVLVERPSDDGRARVRLVDHGVSFHVERKLRTVGWHFADEPIAEGDRRAVAALAGALASGDVGDRLAALLSDAEVEALRGRVDEVAALDRFPAPTGPNPFPWPLL